MEQTKMKKFANRKRKAVKLNTYIDKSEAELESLVFGEGKSLFKDDASTNKRIRNKKFIRKSIIKCKEAKPLWEDEDDVQNDDCAQVKLGNETALEIKFKKIVGEASWAKLDESGENDSHDLIRFAGSVIKKSSVLPSGTLDISVCNNLHLKNKDLGSVSNIEFHKQLQVVLIAGSKDNCVISRVDGDTNEPIQTLDFGSTAKISSAHWTADGHKVIASSFKNRFLYLYDVVAGKTSKIFLNSESVQREVQFVKVSPDGIFYVVVNNFGYVQLLSCKTHECLQTLKMNRNVSDVTFDPLSDTLYCSTVDGLIHVWNMKTGNCVRQFIDEGRVSGGKIAVVQDHLAIGSGSGVVNIYDINSTMTDREPQPLKTIFNLTTEVTALTFNSSCEILALASHGKSNSVRLFHMPSLSVFNNFPLPSYQFGRVSAVDFSPHSGYFSVGTQGGVVSLYRFVYFENY